MSSTIDYWEWRRLASRFPSQVYGVVWVGEWQRVGEKKVVMNLMDVRDPQMEAHRQRMLSFLGVEG